MDAFMSLHSIYFQASPALTYMHTNMFEHTRTTLSLWPNLALNLTNGLSCEHHGHPGEEDRRAEEMIVCGGLDGQRRAGN